MPQDIPRHICDTKCILGLGSNLQSDFGDPAATISAACLAIQSESGRIVSVSRFYATPCLPAGAGPDYVNAVLILSTQLSAEALLATLHVIENRFARVRGQRWGARTLDLDLLDYGGAVQPDAAIWQHWYRLAPERQAQEAPECLILPHPRIQDRGFVLVPLAEIAPDWVHPVLGRSARQLLASLPAEDISAISPLTAPRPLRFGGGDDK